MNECSTEGTKTYTSCASLAALGVKLNEMNLFEPIRRRVQIAQKTVKDRPIDKVYDGWIALLAGAHGLVEINSRLRAEPALQVAFGRSRCAEQSVVQQTLDACTQENVQQMEEARFDEDEKWIVFYDAQYAAEKAAWDLLRQTGDLVAALQ